MPKPAEYLRKCPIMYIYSYHVICTVGTEENADTYVPPYWQVYSQLKILVKLIECIS